MLYLSKGDYISNCLAKDVFTSPSPGEYKCGLCDKLFGVPAGNLAEHLRSAHAIRDASAAVAAYRAGGGASLANLFTGEGGVGASVTGNFGPPIIS